MSSDIDAVHEWISFEDPDEARTWVFDATYLRSNHRCIYGEGCQGVLDEPAEQLAQGCCSYGAHFVDEEDVATVVKAFVRLKPRHMQFYKQAEKDGFLRPGDDQQSSADSAITDGASTAGASYKVDDQSAEPTTTTTTTTTTRSVKGACIFLNRPGFEGGTGCALHLAALEAGERPLDWKPNVCWQVPLRLEHSTDENGHVTSRLREWKRRDWGTGGDDFAWWCTEAPEAFSGKQPTYQAARDEIVELVDEEIYRRMANQLERPEWVPLPHPTLRE